MRKDREVVVTGMGVVSPCGIGCGPYWDNLKAGRSGIDWITLFDVADWPVRYAGEVRGFDAERYMKRHRPSKRDRCLQMGLVAAAEALSQARLIDDSQTAIAPFPIAAVVGSGAGPCYEIEESSGTYFLKGRRSVRPTTVPRIMFNALPSNLSIYFGLRGANHVIASACASGSAAIGHAYLLVKSGVESAVLCGGSDSTLCVGLFAAWTAMNVMARHEVPQQACRPFDSNRSGLVLAEGAAMIVLESEESALQRGADILARMAGYGASSDAYHITAPSKEGQVLAMRRCLEDAQVEPREVDYINAHGTGTRSNDQVEAGAICEVFGARGADMPVNSSKSMLGHSLGACGALEFVACVESLRHGYVHPTINCEEPDPDVGLDYVALRGRNHDVRTVMSNSFAFGGNNAVFLLRRFA